MSRRSYRGIGATVFAALLAAACGTAPPRPSPAHEAAIQLNQRAQTAHAGGELAQSLLGYQQALAANRAIENIDGIATELMNVAAVYWELGRSAETHAALDELLDAPAIPFSDAQRAEAAYRKANFLFESGQQEPAGEWMDKARGLCETARCAAEGKIANLQARRALTRADVAGAVAQARTALAANRRHADRAEEANSLRLMGDAALRLGDFESARAAYGAALEIDKALGASRKIALDLLGLGETRLGEGRGDDAADYFGRALSVARAAGDETIAGRARELATRARR